MLINGSACCLVNQATDQMRCIGRRALGPSLCRIRSSSPSFPASSATGSRAAPSSCTTHTPPNQALHTMRAALCGWAIRQLVGRPSCVSLIVRQLRVRYERDKSIGSYRGLPALVLWFWVLRLYQRFSSQRQYGGSGLYPAACGSA